MPFDATPISSPVIDRLRAGRAVVARPDGWCHGVYQDDGGRFCVVAAVGFEDAISGHALRYLKIALVGRDAPEMIRNTKLISDWQDEDGRQQHEVVELCDRAIEIRISDELEGVVA